jgi:hypothetical protein
MNPHFLIWELTKFAASDPKCTGLQGAEAFIIRTRLGLAWAGPNDVISVHWKGWCDLRIPFSIPNLGADQIFSTGVSTAEHPVILVSRI